MAKGLDNRERIFVERYLVSLKPDQAALEAGYSESMAKSKAYQWVSNGKVKPHVYDAIKKGLRMKSERAELDQDYVVNGLRDTVERCQQAKPVLDKAGNPVMVETKDGEMAPAYTFDPSNTIRGLELLGKHIGMWPNRKELTGLNGAPIGFEDYTGLSEIERNQRIQALLAKAESDD